MLTGHKGRSGDWNLGNRAFVKTTQLLLSHGLALWSHPLIDSWCMSLAKPSLWMHTEVWRMDLKGQTEKKN